MKTVIFLYGIAFGIMFLTGVTFSEFKWAIPAVSFACLAYMEGKKIR